MDTEETLDLVGEIYDASLDPGLWPEILDRITEFVDGDATALVSHDIASRDTRFYYIRGDNPEYTKSYRETYVRINPILPAILSMEVGDIWSVQSFLPWKQFLQTRFYREWIEPQDGGDILGTTIERAGTVVTTLSTAMGSRRSPVNEPAKRRLALLFPHVRRAVAIGNVVEMNRIRAESLGDAVDAMNAGVFLVGASGEIVHANSLGRQFAEDGSLVKARGDRLEAAQGGERSELACAIGDAAGGDRAIGGRGTAIPLTDHAGGRYVAHVLPLTSGQRRRAALSTGAVAAVFIHRAEVRTVFPLEALARQFSLSKAELRVLVGVIEVGPPAEVAPVLGVSEATVRSHLRRLFEKTGTQRQADLVKLVAGYANPVLADAA
jgi:DNA-binding CsgD family transcriptional regulator